MPVPLSETFGKQQRPYRRGSFRIEITRTIGLWPKRGVALQWILRGVSEGTGYTFKIYRSGSFEGPWTQIGTDLTDTYYYIDTDFPAPNDRTAPSLNSLRRAMYYKVEVSHTTDGDASSTQAVEPGLDRRRQGQVRKLRRDAHVALKKGNGTEVAIVKRKWWGEKCPDCQTVTGHSTRSHCDTCKGTGIVDGYWDPVYGFARRDATPVENQTTPGGIVETHRLRVTMEYYPEVAPRDVLVFLRDNKRYIIDRVITTEIHTRTVHQELEVSELSHSSVEFDITADKWKAPPWF